MDKIKIFFGYWEDAESGDVKDTQKEVNKWLEKNQNIRIKNMIQSYHDEEYILTIHYTTNTEELLS